MEYIREDEFTDPRYGKICQKLLDIPMDKETYEALYSILYTGRYQDYILDTGYSNRINAMAERCRRIGMAYLLLRNKDTFYNLVENRVNLFHGTNANALPSILKYGISYLNELHKKNIDVTTGEGARTLSGFISFTDAIDVAMDYSSISPEQKNKTLDFPVVFGITTEVANAIGTRSISSKTIEVGVVGSVEPRNISAIMVPTDKIDLVKKMVGDQITVLGLDGANEKFYYIDDVELSIGNEAFKKFEYQVTHNEFPKSETITGVNETLLSRMASKVKKKIEKLKDLIGVESNEHRNIR